MGNDHRESVSNVTVYKPLHQQEHEDGKRDATEGPHGILGGHLPARHGEKNPLRRWGGQHERRVVHEHGERHDHLEGTPAEHVVSPR